VERQLELRQQMPFADLQQWLQLTYEIETKYFVERRQSTELQLISAKDMVQCFLFWSSLSADEIKSVLIRRERSRN